VTFTFAGGTGGIPPSSAAPITTEALIITPSPGTKPTSIKFFNIIPLSIASQAYDITFTSAGYSFIPRSAAAIAAIEVAKVKQQEMNIVRKNPATLAAFLKDGNSYGNGVNDFYYLRFSNL
jgi:hypothetical protein